MYMVSIYNTCMKLAFISATLYILYLMRYKKPYCLVGKLVKATTNFKRAMTQSPIPSSTTSTSSREPPSWPCCYRPNIASSRCAGPSRSGSNPLQSSRSWPCWQRFRRSRIWLGTTWRRLGPTDSSIFSPGKPYFWVHLWTWIGSTDSRSTGSSTGWKLWVGLCRPLSTRISYTTTIKGKILLLGNCCWCS